MHDRHSRGYAPPPPDGHSLADERAAYRYPVEGAAGRAARVRQQILAVFLPVTAVLYVGCEALDPKGTDELVTNTAVAVKLLPISAAHSSQLYLSGSLSLLALGGLAVSYAAIATLVTGRGWSSPRSGHCSVA